jgi:hypothetical protein
MIWRPAILALLPCLWLYHYFSYTIAMRPKQYLGGPTTLVEARVVRGWVRLGPRVHVAQNRRTKNHPFAYKLRGKQYYVSIPHKWWQAMILAQSATYVSQEQRRNALRHALGVHMAKDESYLEEEQTEALIKHFDRGTVIKPKGRVVSYTTTTVGLLGVMAIGAAFCVGSANAKEYAAPIRKLHRDVESVEPPPHCWSNNLRNQLVGLCNRALRATAEPVEGMWAQVLEFMKEQIETVKVRVYSFKEFLQTVPGAKRMNFTKAYDDYLVNGLKPLVYRAFVKRELLPPKKQGESVAGDPRVIQAPPDQYKVVLGMFTKPLGKELARQFHVLRPLCYASGLTPLEVGYWMHYTLQLWPNANFIETDYSRWDATLPFDALVVEHVLFEECFGLSGDALTMLRNQTHTRGYSTRHLSYEVSATRKSGDPNTSCGNSLLNLGVNGLTLFRMFGEAHVRLIVLGDDMLAAVDPEVWSKWNAGDYIQSMIDYGLEPKLKVHETHWKASFCSSYFWPVETDLGPSRYILGQKVGRFMSKFGYAIGPVTRADAERLRGVVLSMLPHSEAIPGVRRVLARHLGKGGFILPDWVNVDVHGQWTDLPGMVTATALTDVMCLEIYGMSCQEIDNLAIGSRSLLAGECLASEE